MEPKISVVIPAFNEEKLLPRCLDSLNKQSFPKERFEVIVVDNGSKDNTAAIARSFKCNIYQYTAQQGPSAARKYGIANAKGTIIAFTDADSVVSSTWLETIDKIFNNSSVVCIGGRALPDYRNAWIRFIFLLYDISFWLSDKLGRTIMGGYNMAVMKSAYDAVGGLDSAIRSGDDFDLIVRLRNRFGRERIRYIPKLEVTISTRKQEEPTVFAPYFYSGLQNYINIIIRGKKKAAQFFNVR